MNLLKLNSSRTRNFLTPARKGILLLSLAMMVVLAFANSAAAQSTTGALRGQVLDSSGAAVPLAEVSVTNQETGVVVSITTTSAGTYNIPSIIPGLYSVAVQSKGFKSTTKKDVNVLANQENVADI